ncbi:HGxxPAAW family protein, partial [Microbacterium gubbeenense]
MTNPIGDPGHGHSPAAWTAILIMLVAVSIGTVALYLDQIWLV